MTLSTGYVRTHIYIENMRTKKALSEWIPLVSVFCSSGAISGIRGRQMTPAVASERSIFSKNHDYNTYNNIKNFPCRGEHVYTYLYFWIQMHVVAENYEQTQTHTHTHTHTWDWHSDDDNKDYSKRCSSIGIIQRTLYTHAKPLNMKHMR